MKKNTYCRYLFIPVCVICCMLFSCNKFLDKKSNMTLITPSSVSDLQALLDDGATMNSYVTPSYLETASDDYFLTMDVYNSLGDYANDYIWKYRNYIFGNDWNKCYLPVYNANLALDGITKVERNKNNGQEWDNIKGSALYYRAYYFLWLLWDFAKAYDSSSNSDLGIVLRLNANFNTLSVRSYNQDCYEKVISDIKESLQYLPAYPQHVYRPSKVASFALLARTYLSMRKYDLAGTWADSCLRLQSALMDFNDPSIYNTGGVAAAFPFKQFNKEIIFYTEQNNIFLLHLPSFSFVDSFLYAHYSDADIRKKAFFQGSGNNQIYKGSYSPSSNTLFSGLAVDEMYLIRAECRLREGNIQAALDDYNFLKSSRYVTGGYMPLIDGTHLLDSILLERRKELLFRGLRWMDIKRLNKEGYNIIPRRKIGSDTVFLMPNSGFYALPLPQDIIDLTGIRQNE